ncbi:MAG TPA: hypothetical protein VFI19_08100 [Nocardioides sp.]|nr:hypothetical protein [Nocardioides sp.]
MRAHGLLRGVRRALLVAAVVVVPLLPVLDASAPALAAGCQAETGLLFCDDVTPPDTVLLGVRPVPNSHGYINGRAVSFDFRGVAEDASDTGTITFQCQLFNTVSPPSDASWQTCASGQSYTGLTDTTATPYTFRVRAVDATDAAVSCPICTDTPDYDQSPAATTIRVDTAAPNTFMTRTPQDDIRPDWPVSLSRSTQVTLNSNEGGVGFVCRLNGEPRPCAEGVVTLEHLASGPQKLSAQAVDAAGNADPTPAVTRFFVPADITAPRGSDWRRINQPGAFGGGLVRASRVGALLRIGGQRKVRELRLIAPAGPHLGRVEVRVGRSRWYPVDLSGKASSQKTYVVRNHFAPVQSGAILIRVVSLPAGGSVQLDAFVARR